MKFFALALACIGAASAGIVQDYGSAGSISAAGGASMGGGSAYDEPAPQPQGYGQPQQEYKSERRCTPYFDTISSDHCESYIERTCQTTQKESCNDVADQNCRAVVTSKQVRKCFDVQEERCSLKEDVTFETIQVPFVVQKCHKVNERVCDTVYETARSSNDEQACITVENPVCRNVENTIYDRTCRTTTQFNCDSSLPDYAPPQPQYPSGGDSYGSGNAGGDAYPAPAPQQGYSAQSAYGQPKPNCRRNEDTKCYKTPRTVSVQECSRNSERVCERLSESVPSVQARQSCRNEEKKVCELEERQQPKQVKKYVYRSQCRPQPRKVCENSDVKSLVPSCVGTTRKQCSYSPVEACVDEPKKHCFQVQQRVKKQRCEVVQVPVYPQPSQPSYPAQAQPSYPAPAQPEYQ